MAEFNDIDIETSENVDINLSPLIDMMFLLLIFFMVTSVFVHQTGVEVSKPESTTAQQLQDNSIRFALTGEGTIMHRGEQVSMNRVRTVVSRLTEQQARPVIIEADKRSYTEKLITLIDECKAGGAERVSVATEKP